MIKNKCEEFRANLIKKNKESRVLEQRQSNITLTQIINEIEVVETKLHSTLYKLSKMMNNGWMNTERTFISPQMMSMLRLSNRNGEIVLKALHEIRLWIHYETKDAPLYYESEPEMENDSDSDNDVDLAEAIQRIIQNHYNLSV